MSEQPQGLPAAGSGQNQTTSPAPQGQGEPPQGAAPKYLTEADVLELIKRQGQSIADRTTARVQKVLDAARAQGITLTNQQAEAVLGAIGEPPAAQNPPPAAHPTAPAQTPPPATAGASATAETPDAEADDPVTASAKTILRSEYQLDPDQVDPADPEYALLDLATTDPDQFIASVRAYGEAKAKRVQQNGDLSRLPGLAGKGAPSSAPAHANQSGSDILEAYYRSRPV